jgi:hypothetical protein
MYSTVRAAVITAAFVCLPFAAHAGARANANANSASNASAIGVGNAFGNQSSRSTAYGGAGGMGGMGGTGIGGAGGSASANNRNTFSPTNSVNQSFTYNDPPANSGTGAGNGNNVGNTNVHVPYQAPSVFAPSGTSSACTDTFSFGASGPGGGLSFGLPWRNKDCNRRADTGMLWSMGLRGAAKQRMCMDDETGAAMAAAGFRCRVGPYAPKVVQTRY